MKIDLSKNSINIEWEDKNEEASVKQQVYTWNWIFNPTYIVWVNGIKIEGKEVKER